MAISNDWTNKSLKIQQETEKAAAFQAGVNQGMQIAAHPYDDYKATTDDIEYLKKLYKNLPGLKEEPGTDPVDVFDGIQGEFDLSKEPVLPNFKPMGSVIKGVREGVLPLKDTKIKQNLQIGPQAGATSRQIRDRLKPFTKGSGYDKEGGSLQGVPAPLRIQLLRDAMAKNQLPANYIRRLKDTGHMTIPQNPDGTGPLRIIDLLGPQNPPQAQCIRGDLNFHPRPLTYSLF